MNTSHHETFKTVGDLGASATSALVIASHWAEIFTPILTFLIALATLIWWGLRFADRWDGAKEEDIL